MVLLGVLAGGALATAVDVAFTAVGTNLHTVAPGRVYRCAQPDAFDLPRLVNRYGIRTVINLRGPCLGFDFYEEEGRATEALDLDQEDVRMSACRLPSVHEVRRLVEIFDRAAYPLLIHCRRGSDRTGLVSAMYLMLHADVSYDEARAQLGLRFGHFPFGQTSQLDRFFRLYSGWLASEGSVHSPTTFRRWLTAGYCPGEYRGRIEMPEPPVALPCGKTTAVRVRCRNTSGWAWRLRPGSTTGIHAVYQLFADDGTKVCVDRAGLFDADVPPGESIDLTLALPTVRAPGVYRLIVDLADEQHCLFVQEGSEPFETELRFQ